MQLNAMEKFNISQIIAFGLVFPELSFQQRSNYILECYKKYPEKVIPFAQINDSFEFLDKNKNIFKGIKEHFLLTKNMNDKQLLEKYDYIQEHHLPLLIHPSSRNSVSKIRKIIDYFPNITIILAHCGRKKIFSTIEIIQEVIPFLKKFDNVFFETSTVNNSDAITQIVKEVGKERVLFGSDRPFTTRNCLSYLSEIDTIAKADLSETAKLHIFSRNFQNLFNKNNNQTLLVNKMLQSKNIQR